MTRESIPSLLAEHRIDALIAAAPESLGYLADIYILAQRLIPMLEVTETGARLLSSPSEWSELLQIR